MAEQKISDVSILVADDEKQLLAYMVEYLQLFFEHVYQAGDGLNAYRIYESKKPDIIIADINMPLMDGLTMIKKIRRRDAKTRIIITSAHSEKEKLMQAIELHLVKYLIKPVQSDLLKALLLSQVDELRQHSNRLLLKEGFFWDRGRKLLFKDEAEVTLTVREKKVLELLCSHADRTVSVFDIYNVLYEEQPDREFSSDAITSLMKRLRPKLPPETVSTDYGVGYILHSQ